jgi:hypothetical protein
VRSLLLLLIVCLFASSPYACESNATCDKCKGEPEFTWNPENRYVTSRLNRFYALEDEIKAAYERHADGEMKNLTDEYLALALTYRCNWNYGNAIHDANRYLGLMSLRNGKADEAAAFLVLSGKSTGSPQLNSFGPELDLANHLLKAGKIEPVKEYLRGIKSFWKMDNGQVDAWLSAIDHGEKPELDRFSAMKPNPWLIVLGLFVAALPAITVLSLMYAGRKRLSRKMVFLVVGLVSGYVTFALVNLGTMNLVSILAATIESTGFLLLFSVVFLPIILTVGAPVLAVFVIYRYFSRNPRP